MAETSRQSWADTTVDANHANGEWAMWKIAVAVLVIEAPPIGLASSAVTDFHHPWIAADRDPMMIIVVAVAGFIEVCWILCAAILLLCCGLHLIFFLSLAVVTILSFGTGVFALVAMGMGFTSSVCDADLSPGQCEVGLRKGLAAGCLKILITTAAYAYVTYWYFWGGGRRQVKASREEEQQGQDAVALFDVTK